MYDYKLNKSLHICKRSYHSDDVSNDFNGYNRSLRSVFNLRIMR